MSAALTSPDVIDFMTERAGAQRTARQIADDLNAAGLRTWQGKLWKRDNVRAHMLRHDIEGLHAPKPEPFTVEQYERIWTLAAEGMPITWIAEDLGVDYKRLQEFVRRFRSSREANREWLSAWQQIRTHEELLALHREFAPPTVREYRVAS